MSQSEPDKKKPQQSRRKPPPLPKPSAYDITEPFQDRGLWCFNLAADSDVLEYVSSLNCIAYPSQGPFRRRLSGRVTFSINPRYDHEEVYLWLLEVLESETELVVLSETWEDAIDAAQKGRPTGE